jgi:hypothetical protein
VQRNQSTQTRKASYELRFRSEDRSIACLGSGRKGEEEEEKRDRERRNERENVYDLLVL